MVRSIDLLTRAPGLARAEGVPPRFLLVLPALGGMIKWAATHLPEPQLVTIVRGSRDMMDGWLEAAEGADDAGDETPAGPVVDAAGDRPAERG